MKKRAPWYQDLQIIGWIVGGVTALGTGIVVAARYIELPAKVEAAQQKNVQQDDAINKLTGIQETWQKIYQQQQAQVPNLPAPPVVLPMHYFREQDERTGAWWCCALPDRAACFTQRQWKGCE